MAGLMSSDVPTTPDREAGRGPNELFALSRRRRLLSNGPANGSAAACPQSLRYRNNLMITVGFLDLTNALDFPANVWNEVPVPRFAQVLMGVGGSFALLWTAFALWDSMRSWRNIRFLRMERRQLTALHRSTEVSAPDPLVQAWLDVNFRELGWEVIDRFLMDAFMGVAGILIGSGTLMAIRGDIPTVFAVSNLLSGYIGNSFVGLYAVFNVAFGVYLFMRAQKHLHVATDTSVIPEVELRTRMRNHALRHRVYPILNSVTILVSAVGSLLSATLWPGYVVIAPTVFGSVFCNLFWRHTLGYNRPSYSSWAAEKSFDPHAQLKTAIALRSTLKAGQVVDLEDFVSLEEDQGLSCQKIEAFMDRCCLYEAFRSRLSGLTGEVSSGSLESEELDIGAAVSAAQAVLSIEESQRFRDQERFLLELYSCFLLVERRDRHVMAGLPDEKAR